MIVCLLAGTGTSLSAQTDGWTYYTGMTKSDQVFNPVNSNWLRHQFIINLEKGNQVNIQVANKTQLLSLLNIDSILQKVSTVLKPLKDSLNNELNNIRIDYTIDQADNIKIRTRIYDRPVSHYVIQKGELSALKIEQDTLVISGVLKQEKAERISFRGINNTLPYRITLLLNNYEQLSNLLNGSLNGILEQIRSEWNSYSKWTPEKNWKYNLYGYYNTQDPSNHQRLRNSWNRNQYHSSFAPYVHIAVQSINGRYSPSVATGLEFINSINNTENHFQLYWEPYFYFDKTSTGKNKMFRNDFISFQHTSTTFADNEKSKVRFGQIFSAGYLVHRSGNYLEKNTFKFGVPGVQYRFLFLHPEFVFNDLFKNFHPSLKLMLYLD